MINDSVDLSEFELVDDKLFDELEMSDVVNNNNEIDYCYDCDMKMQISADHYKCQQCGQISKLRVDINDESKHNSNNAIRINNGKGKGRYYNVNSDYTKIQYKVIMDQLIQNQTDYISVSSSSFPMSVLEAAATKYNKIQKEVPTPILDESGNIIGQKKFVHRGDIKNEVLAALIYFAFIDEGIVRKKKDIATFMKLPSAGLSRGENLLRNLEATGEIELPINKEPIIGFVDRYFEILNIDSPNYKLFVIDIVDTSETINLGMSSHIPSKIVGTMWLLIQKCKLNINSDQLGKAADDIKKNTFMKFFNILKVNTIKFKDIFTRHNIPY